MEFLKTLNSVEPRIRLVYLVYPPVQKGHGLCLGGWVRW
jgi:hypothetical protein